jgi:hypothetical protein
VFAVSVVEGRVACHSTAKIRLGRTTPGESPSPFSSCSCAGGGILEDAGLRGCRALLPNP